MKKKFPSIFFPHCMHAWITNTIDDVSRNALIKGSLTLDGQRERHRRDRTPTDTIRLRIFASARLFIEACLLMKSFNQFRNHCIYQCGISVIAKFTSQCKLCADKILHRDIYVIVANTKKQINFKCRSTNTEYGAPPLQRALSTDENSTVYSLKRVKCINKNPGVTTTLFFSFHFEKPRLLLQHKSWVSCFTSWLNTRIKNSGQCYYQ